MGEHKRPRRPSYYRATLAYEIRRGVIFGLALAGFFCLYVLVVYAILGDNASEKDGVSLGAVLAVYITSGFLGGVVYGLLNPLGRTLSGKIVIGVVIGALVFAAITTAMHGMPTRWDRTQWSGIAILGLILGVVGGVVAHKQRWGDL